MKDTEEESAILKQALKHLPCTPELITEAEAFPEEAGEAIQEVQDGYEEADPGSWVALYLADDPSVVSSAPVLDDVVLSRVNEGGLIVWVRRAPNGTIMVDVDTPEGNGQPPGPRLIVNVDDHTLVNTEPPPSWPQRPLPSKETA